MLTLEALDSWIAAARAQGELAIASAATASDATRADLVGLALALAPGRACYVPLAHKSPRRQGDLDLGDGMGDSGAPAQAPMRDALANLGR